MAKRSARGAIATLVVSCVALGGCDSASDEAIAATRLQATGVSARWKWPVTPPRIVAPFQAPPGPYAAGHRGIDLGAARGQPVFAPAGGVLTVAQTVVDRPVVTIRVSSRVVLSMEPVTATVPLGTALAAGQPVGEVDAGGHCDGGCVHLGVRVDGEYVSPLLFLAGVPPAVLLPAS